MLRPFASGCFLRYTDPGGRTVSETHQEVYVGFANKIESETDEIIVSIDWLVRIRKSEDFDSSDDPEWQPIGKATVAPYEMRFSFTRLIESGNRSILFQSESLWVELAQDGDVPRIAEIVKKQLEEQNVLR